MNAAEKARLAKEKSEAQKRKKKETFLKSALTIFKGALVALNIILVAVMTLLSSLEMTAPLAVIHPIGIGFLVVDIAVGLFFFFKYADADFPALMTCTVIILGLVLFCVSSMI